MSGAARAKNEAVCVGIAGWSYQDWKGTVYPRGCRDTLRFCARFVDCIEINSTFYRPPDARMCASWASRTADSPVFFTAKLPRIITHEKRLDAAIAEQVRTGFAPLLEAGKLRVLLAQFSHQFAATAASRSHVVRIADAFGDLAPLALEVRHASWAEDSALALINDHPLSLVHLDYPGSASGFGLHSTGILGPAQIAYFRLHGRNHDAWFRKNAGRDEVYDYDYAPAEVRQIVTRVEEIAAGAKQTIVIGNNHFRGQGMKVVLELLAALRDRKIPVPNDLLTTYPGLRSLARGASRGLFDP